MSEESEKKNLVDSSITGIAVVFVFVAFVIAYAEGAFNRSFESKAGLIIILTLWPIISFIDYLNKHIKKGDIRKRTVILSLVIRGILVTLLVVSLYRIFYSQNYSLKYTYWIALVSFATIMISSYIERLIREYRTRKFQGKKRNILNFIVSLLLLLIWPSIIGYNFSVKYVYPKRQMVLDNLKIPKSITIYRHDRKFGKVTPNFNSKIEIVTPEDIHRIINDLHTAKIERITGTNLINYTRMKDDNLQYYLLMLHYSGTNNWTDALEDGYIDFIVLTGNGNTVIEERRTRDRLILGPGDYYETFPITLSQETLDMIFAYIKLQ